MRARQQREKVRMGGREHTEGGNMGEKVKEGGGGGGGGGPAPTPRSETLTDEKYRERKSLAQRDIGAI